MNEYMHGHARDRWDKLLSISRKIHAPPPLPESAHYVGLHWFQTLQHNLQTQAASAGTFKTDKSSHCKID